MKKRQYLVALLFALLTFFSFAFTAEAVSWPSVNSGNYCEFVAKKTIYVYKDTACRTRGTISPSKKYNAYIARNDVCYVYKFTNNYLQVSYPTSSGRRVGYIKRSDFVVSSGITEPDSYSTARGKATTYKYTGGESYGYTETGDGIYSLGTSGSYTAIIYTARSGKRAYKYAFVRTTDYNSLLKNKENDDYALPAEGLYTFQSAINKEKVIDVSGAKTENGTNVGLWKSNGGNHQKFNLRLESDGWYKILDCNSGKALDVKGGSTESGANVQIWTSNSNDQQLWKFYSAGNGYYFVKNKLGNYLDLSGGIAEDGRNIQVWTGNNSDAQKWYLLAVNEDNEKIGPSKYKGKYSGTPQVGSFHGTEFYVFSQKDKKWAYTPYKRGTINGKIQDTNIYHAGCHLLSLVNGAYWLSGKFIDPAWLANYAIEKGYRITDGIKLDELYNDISKNYGNEYGIRCKGCVYSFNDLKKHLEDGCIGLGGGKGHVMMFAAYEDGKYLILDSYFTYSGNKYVWKTLKQMTGRFDCTYFYIFEKR